MLHNEPVLKLVSLKKIKLQENHDDVRLSILVKKMKADKVLRDPPIVTDGIDKNLLQLDGTTRLNALKKIGCDHAVVQYVDYTNTQQVAIKSWMHISKVNQKLFISGIKNLKDIKFEEFKLGLGLTLTGHPLAAVTIIFRDGTGLSIINDNGLSKSVDTIQKIVDLYSQLITRDHQIPIESKEQLDLFFEKHQTMNVALVFPSFSATQILKLMKKNKTLPEGLTRHVIQGRILRLNYPLEMLHKKLPLVEKKKYFKKFLKEISLRYYEESIFVAE